MNKKVKFSGLWTAILSVVSVAYIFPILLVLINSFKNSIHQPLSLCNPNG